MSAYIRPVAGPDLTGQHQRIEQYFWDNLAQVWLTIADQSGRTYTAPAKRHLDHTVVPGFLFLPAQDLITDLFRHAAVTDLFRRCAGLQAMIDIDELTPHTDDGRHVNLLYLVAGPADTVFYTVKPGHEHRQGQVYTQDQVQEQQRHRLEIGRWYWVNTYAIHSVQDLGHRPRLGITVSLDHAFDDFGQACEVLEQRLFR
jgi:hypothetical protein